MASETKNVSVMPLKGSNYPTWKIQCRMALMKDGLWSIVDESETAPPRTEADKYAKFVNRRNRALAIIVLSIDPSLLYLLGDPQDPVTVWKKIADQFQKKTWANKLALRRKLYSLKLSEGQSVQNHIKTMTELFEELTIIGDPIKEEDRVVHMLASLPEAYDVLVTALEANEDVPKMEVVTERLMREEMKLKEKEACGASSHDGKALTSQRRFAKKGPTCNHCGKIGHIKRNCFALHKKEEKNPYKEKQQRTYSTVQKHRKNDRDSDSDVVALVVHELALGSTNENMDGWIIDSGATSHMCKDLQAFTDLSELDQPEEISVGDGHIVKATQIGTVKLDIEDDQGQVKRCKLQNVLFVPELAYNLISVPKLTKTGKAVMFGEPQCTILDDDKKTVAVANKVGGLYYLNVADGRQAAHTTVASTNETTWHRRYGHVGFKSLEILAANQLVNGFDYKKSQSSKFCEPCLNGKHSRSKFPGRVMLSRDVVFNEKANHAKQSEEDEVNDATESHLLELESLSNDEVDEETVDDETNVREEQVLRRSERSRQPTDFFGVRVNVANHESRGEFFMIAVYVDDIILGGKTQKRMTEVKKELADKFTIKDMGKLHHFLGVKIVRNKDKGETWMGQESYVKELLQKFQMEQSKPVSTPVQTTSNLVKASDEDELVDQEMYQSAGSKLFLSRCIIEYQYGPVF
eukprot:gene6281-7003_t